MILSLPSFTQKNCSLDLPAEVHFGVAGLVTDDDQVSRLMVCSRADCFLRTGAEWEAGHAMVENR